MDWNLHALASRTSCITRGRGGWLDLPRGGLSPPILCQLSWRTRRWVKMSRGTHYRHGRTTSESGGASESGHEPPLAVQKVIAKFLRLVARLKGLSTAYRSLMAF